MTRLTIPDLHKLKAEGTPIAMLTAYDATFARLLDDAGADVLLVGDTLGMLVQGHSSTLPVTMDHIVYHTQMVVRGSKRAMVVGDMPFMSYQVTVEDAMRNAGRLLAEAGCQAVKLEGGTERILAAARAMVEVGVPVMGHLGLTPQSVNLLGGFRVQARGPDAAEKLIEAALALEAAGVFAIVLECIPAALAQRVSEALAIPTIGIGAGVGCDGQVLVCYDLLGLYDGFSPRFLKRYADMAGQVREAVRAYVSDVKARQYPGDEHSY